MRSLLFINDISPYSHHFHLDKMLKSFYPTFPSGPEWDNEMNMTMSMGLNMTLIPIPLCLGRKRVAKGAHFSSQEKIVQRKGENKVVGPVESEILSGPLCVLYVLGMFLKLGHAPSDYYSCSVLGRDFYIQQVQISWDGRAGLPSD